MKSNYVQAIAWIDSQLDKPTMEIKIRGEIIHDLNYSLEINKNHILLNNGQVSLSAYHRTKKIKDYLLNKK